MRSIAIAVALLVSTVSLARADDPEVVMDAQSWLDTYLNSDMLKAPTKKAPLYYGVFPYAASSCGAFEKKRVDKITSKKMFNKLASCLSEALGEQANATWAVSDIDMLLIGFDQQRGAEKKIRKALKKLTIVSLEVQNPDDPSATHVFFALDKKGNVRGVYLYVDAAS